MAIQRYHVEIHDDDVRAVGPRYRYTLLTYMHQVCLSRNIRWLAFGFDAEGLRLILEGPPRRLEAALVRLCQHIRNVSRSRYHDPRVDRVPLEEPDLHGAVVWAHRAPCEADPTLPGPLASPWSSHRDLLGYRCAPFFDRTSMVGRVNLSDIHEASGGGLPPARTELRSGLPPRPRGRIARRGTEPREDMLLLSHVAGCVLGRDPSDPKCFRLFAQLARARGWMPREIAGELLVSTRRVRQLCELQARELGLALTALTYPDTVGRLP